MKLEIDMPEHHYNNIMSIDSVSLGRVPYKGIIMYTINAIKHGRVLEQEPTTKNDLGVDLISRADAIKAMQEKSKRLKNLDTINGLCGAVAILYDMPSVTLQEPKTGKWVHREDMDYLDKIGVTHNHFMCNKCGLIHDFIDGHTSQYNYCPQCGAKMAETEVDNGEID